MKRAFESDGASGVPKRAASDTDHRPVCMYDPGCTRQNLRHFADFAHPTLERQQAIEAGLPVDDVGVGAMRGDDDVAMLASPPTASSSSSSSRPDRRAVYVFRLNRVREVPAVANVDTWSIEDLIQGGMEEVVLSNFEVDLAWLYERVPRLRTIPKVTLLHGHGPDGAARLEATKAPNLTIYRPQVLPYGTHHSKVILVRYQTGIRVVVCTANFVSPDWDYKTEAIWAQDFPPKTETSPIGSIFERDLVNYFAATKTFDPKFLKEFDYSRATGELVGSSPGFHSGAARNAWGHMKLRQALARESLQPRYFNAPVVCQFSSMGTLTEKWIDEMLSTFASGRDRPLSAKLPSIQLVFPTVDAVRRSTEGYLGGCSIPVPSKNHKPFMRSFRGADMYHHWDGGSGLTGGAQQRQRSMPHIKTYTRYDPQDPTRVAWALVTSSNLSKAAWGELQKGDAQITIRSFELGILLHPRSFGANIAALAFSCTPNRPLYPLWLANVDPSEVSPDLVTAAARPATDGKVELIAPFPYSLPPRPYSKEDQPWAVDGVYPQRDSQGLPWPEAVQVATILQNAIDEA